MAKFKGRRKSKNVENRGASAFDFIDAHVAGIKTFYKEKIFGTADTPLSESAEKRMRSVQHKAKGKSRIRSKKKQGGGGF